MEPGSQDRISVRGMLFLARHGVNLDERLEPQPFEIDVDLHKNLSGASASDELADTIDYSALFSLVGTIVEGQSFRLIESLAAAIADAVLAETDATAVDVRVRKPRAPLPGPFETVEVAIHRDRAE
ncbi:MAG: dihydroneopterin aldolase [Chloroflexi bacterium]|jgi:dihydroneopterin aldolase|nr:MAG: dihydroneopterin aldolase [Chloroflexota bacterium]